MSIDNAAVLGAMASTLPFDQGVPWPRRLLFLEAALGRYLDNQRSAALKVGLLGAYLGRGAMLMVAHLVVQNPWLRLVGGAYLVYLGVEHLGQLAADAADEASHHPPKTHQQSFWGVVLAIELADLAFSLDNVVAAVALSTHMAAILLGVGLGILTMRFAATWFANLVEREPVLEPAAYVLVLVIGLRLILEEFLPLHISPPVQFGASLLIILIALLAAHWQPLHSLKPSFFRGLLFMRMGLDFLKFALARPLMFLAGLLQMFWGED